MKKLHLITIILFSLFCISGWIGLAFNIDPVKFGRLEKRSPSTMPNMPTVKMLGDRWDMQRYFNEWDAFLSDRVLGRSLYINSYLDLGLTLSPAVQEALCIQGKDGWLFQGNGGHSRNMLDYTRNSHPVSEKVVLDKCEEVKNIFRVINNAGCYAAFLIAPNKTSIYSEYLPDWVIIKDSHRFADRVYQRLASEGYPVIFPKGEVQNAKPNGQLYFKDDSHWNEIGAFPAFREVMKVFSAQGKKLVFINPSTLVLKHQAKNWAGDLVVTGNLDPRKSDPFMWYYDYPEKENSKKMKTSVIHDAAGYDMVVTENPSALNKAKLLVIGDSFFGYCAHYARVSFSQVVSIHNSALKVVTLQDILARAKADYVLIEQVERYFWKP